MRCPYCYNPHMVLGNGSLSPSDLYDFLRLRQGKLDGVVLSGGECTLYPHLDALCETIKSMGFEIKIDTNGLRPKTIKTLVESDLVDFISLDYKAPKSKFKTITGTDGFTLLQETLIYLIKADISFEVRTTVHPDLLSVEDINIIIEDLHNLGFEGNYAIQNYLHVSPTLGDVGEPKAIFEVGKLKHLIPLQLRNF